MNDETAGQNRAVALFSTIPWSIPIPKTSYLLIAAIEEDLGKGVPATGSIVKNHVFFVELIYSLRVIMIFLL
ncbi:TPA: hypothetical protein U2L65_004839 [Citrobacter farmeri]|uniref:hypothetical protein n=1 Tax=Citrobacter farmeri TaxID=67824 RepID=UPI00189EB430|nr:hypothetical protein [Citrobacter farmeri]EKU0078244.1 hypothetical protein [Citrobacter farmeri]MDZ7528574.1 hypothetical protein [Citrobacter farmeri]GJL45116.1 hypothetical protein TUM17580_11750 [Citrobacter farmeri]HCD1998449.1 hypothetical protein [Citrobacter farmeri]HCD7552260.1 hypothetical protein [Citrobacter farmeri]